MKGDTGTQGITGSDGSTGLQGNTGLKGETGLQGETGPRGFTGLKGDTGLQGNTGLNGPTGLRGFTGLKGDTGEKGNTGTHGVTGLNGPTGLQGDTGTNGPTGLKGDTGLQGSTGVNGPTGLKGDTGLQGNTGVNGPTGLQGGTGKRGDTGERGGTGVNGTTGVQGHTGEKGDTGAQGYTGANGPIGLTGLQGSTGADGPTGLKGDTGLQGNTGVKGETGIQGSTGLKGDTGLQGSTGLKGDTGLNGNTGLQGDTGTKGDTGAKGDTGLQGSTGPTGPTGSKGDTGAKGDTGLQGNTGLQGSTGPTGSKGNTGVKGETGLQGNTGPTGSEGNTGIKGETGMQGVTGSTGSKGDTGLQGNTGIRGETGMQGNTGLNGPTGIQGNTGPMGNIGLTGMTGSAGNLRYNNSVFVDPIYGDDLTAQIESYAYPFKTLLAAADAAQVGAISELEYFTVYVRPGIYNFGLVDSNLYRSYVNWYFEEKSVINNDGLTPLFYDGPDGIPFNILGYGEFNSVNGMTLFDIGNNNISGQTGPTGYIGPATPVVNIMGLNASMNTIIESGSNSYSIINIGDGVGTYNIKFNTLEIYKEDVIILENNLYIINSSSLDVNIDCNVINAYLPYLTISVTNELILINIVADDYNVATLNSVVKYFNIRTNIINSYINTNYNTHSLISCYGKNGKSSSHLNVLSGVLNATVIRCINSSNLYLLNIVTTSAIIICDTFNIVSKNMTGGRVTLIALICNLYFVVNYLNVNVSSSSVYTIFGNYSLSDSYASVTAINTYIINSFLLNSTGYFTRFFSLDGYNNVIINYLNGNVTFSGNHSSSIFSLRRSVTYLIANLGYIYVTNICNFLAYGQNLSVNYSCYCLVNIYMLSGSVKVLTDSIFLPTYHPTINLTFNINILDVDINTISTSNPNVNFISFNFSPDADVSYINININTFYLHSLTSAFTRVEGNVIFSMKINNIINRLSSVISMNNFIVNDGSTL